MIEEESNPELDQEEELFEHHRFKADKGQYITRIDKFLLDRLPSTSRNKIQVAAKMATFMLEVKQLNKTIRLSRAMKFPL